MRAFSIGVSIICAFLAGAVSAAKAQQQYPARPVTMIVPFAAGGPTDVLARILGQHMSQSLGQQVVVENVTGAAGTIGSARVPKAAPDGYTMVMGVPLIRVAGAVGE
jgi:tripartite-type tricarboxylate transporter receptor subunit TctC